MSPNWVQARSGSQIHGRLVPKNLEILDIFQDDVKDNADDQRFISVFISNEGTHSAWSCADLPVIEIAGEPLEVYDKLEKFRMNPGQPNHGTAKIIIGALLNSNNMLREMTKMEPNKLLKDSMFAYHSESKTVTFQSHSVECYIRENAKIFIIKKI
ncbi:7178_t:CDS:2 [Diversispora eburnea]|uniref:7178_t:CDS:1 n=1 Tax=Diversispora eburnea TaxID=1213867 RepID=A0A9N9CTB0_9GLOM|nr:7178_t:CDS:2 [Diversispora eburnea]